jgi:hypothetical protein
LLFCWRRLHDDALMSEQADQSKQGWTGWTGTDPLSFVHLSSTLMMMMIRSERGLVIESEIKKRHRRSRRRKRRSGYNTKRRFIKTSNRPASFHCLFPFSFICLVSLPQSPMVIQHIVYVRSPVSASYTLIPSPFRCLRPLLLLLLNWGFSCHLSS